MNKKILYLFLFTLSILVAILFFSTRIIKKIPDNTNDGKKTTSLQDYANDVVSKREQQSLQSIKNSELIKNEENKKDFFADSGLDEIPTFPKEEAKPRIELNSPTNIYVTKNFLLGKFTAKEYSFVLIDRTYSNKDIYLDPDVYDAFKKMHAAAQVDGVSLRILSAFRSNDSQKGIWNRKWQTFSGIGADKAKNILRYSSMPGTSRHHWGTDMDLNFLENSYFESGFGLVEYNWLVNNARNYGFCQPYTAKNGMRSGYEQEKWHWSYQPKSSEYIKKYNQIISYSDISGFSGFEYADDILAIQNYVNGVNPDCL